MGKYDAELAKLSDWKRESTRLFLYVAGGGVTVWCVGILKHASSAELHFGVDSIDGKDFMLVFNVHRAQFSFVDNRDSLQFLAPQRSRYDFGATVQILLLPGSKGAKVVLGELLGEVIEPSATI